MSTGVITRNLGRAGQSLADGQVASSTGTIFTCPDSLYTRIQQCIFFNTNATAQTINVYITRSGGTRRQIRRWTSVAQYDDNNLIPDESGISLSPGDLLEADTTTATAVDYFICGEVEEIGR